MQIKMIWWQNNKLLQWFGLKKPPPTTVSQSFSLHRYHSYYHLSLAATIKAGRAIAKYPNLNFQPIDYKKTNEETDETSSS